MKIKDFEIELKALDPRLEIRENPNRPGLANVMLGGVDVIPVPADEIKEESDQNYYYCFPNGMMSRHKSRKEVLDRVAQVLEYIKTSEGNEIFFS